MRIKQILLLLIFLKFLLEYAYITFTSKYFSYSGFALDISIFKYIFGWVVYILGYKLLFRKEVYLYLKYIMYYF